MRLLLTLLLLAVAAAPATAGFHLPGDAVEDKRVLLAEPVVIEPTTTAAPTTTTTRVVEWRPRPSWNPVFELTADRHRRLLKITIPEPLLFLRNPVGDYYFHGGYGFYGRSYIDEDGTRVRGCVPIAGSCWQNWPGGEMKRVNAYSFEAEIACDLPWNVIAPSLTMTNQKSQWTDSNSVAVEGAGLDYLLSPSQLGDLHKHAGTTRDLVASLRRNNFHHRPQRPSSSERGQDQWLERARTAVGYVRGASVCSQRATSLWMRIGAGTTRGRAGAGTATGSTPGQRLLCPLRVNMETPTIRWRYTWQKRPVAITLGAQGITPSRR